MEVIHKAVSYTGQEVQGFFVKRTNGTREMNLIDQHGSMVEIDIDTLDLYSIDGRIVQAHANNEDSITIYLEPLEQKELIIEEVKNRFSNLPIPIAKSQDDPNLISVFIVDEMGQAPDNIKTKPKKDKNPATFDKEEFEPSFNPLVD